ncbi:MAG TPA: NBR1-Ig-like domain-containing protein, partial [Anaerolineales bacterium]|nr:NBR1-Ig-like domain-containing protein [Anaerolineales bacterium]
KTPTQTASLTPTPTHTFTPTATFTSTPTKTPTNTFTPTNTLTPSLTPSLTPTKTPTQTASPTVTFTPTFTLTPTRTPTFTFTPTATFTSTFTPTFTPTSTLTNTPTLTSTPTRIPSSTPTINNGCDRAEFVADLNVPDGMTLLPDVTFTKTWRLKNVGTCTWTRDYDLVFIGGDKMDGPDLLPLPATVRPGSTIDLSVVLTSPETAGSYRGDWILRNAKGELFGTGSGANRSVWAAISVAAVTSNQTTAYDLVAKACTAQWTSGAGILPCPGSNDDPRGFVIKLSNVTLEDGTLTNQPGLLTFPQDVTNGYIRGIYPPFTVQKGDHFQGIVNCQRSAANCSVLFRVDYQIGSGLVRDFWAFGEKQDGKYYRVDLDLSPLVGQDVKLVLSILSLGSPTDDLAVWVAPRVVRTSLSTVTPTPSPTGTPTPKR